MNVPRTSIGGSASKQCLSFTLLHHHLKFGFWWSLMRLVAPRLRYWLAPVYDFSATIGLYFNFYLIEHHLSFSLPHLWSLTSTLLNSSFRPCVFNLSDGAPSATPSCPILYFLLIQICTDRDPPAPPLCLILYALTRISLVIHETCSSERAPFLGKLFQLCFLIQLLAGKICSFNFWW